MKSMQLIRCYNCYSQCEEKNLSHCCEPYQIMCLDCKVNKKCLVCHRFYPRASLCKQNCPCIANKKQNTQSPVLKRCIKCSFLTSNCQCKIFQQNKQCSYLQQQKCEKCKSKKQISQLFCNPNCGHYYCSLCLQHNSSKCFCLKSIDQESKNLFLKLCFICGFKLSQGINYSQIQSYLICKNCKILNDKLQDSLNQQTQHQINRYKQQTCNNQSQQKQIKVQQFKIEQFQEQQVMRNKQDKENIYITNQSIIQSHQNSNKINKSKDLTSQYKKQNLEFIPKKNNILQKLSQSQLLSSSKKSNSPICSVCNLIFECTPFRFPKCSKSHSICKVCLAYKDKNKITSCIQCQIEHEQDIKRRFCYQQLKNQARHQYVKQIHNTQSLCNKCQIILPSSKMFGSILICLLCATK